MNFLSAYISGIKAIFAKGKMWWLIYFFNFLFAVFLAYPLSGFLEEKLGNTLATDQLKEGFDFTVFYDFINKYGDFISWLQDQSLIGMLLYLLLSIFLVGGILTVFWEKDKIFRFSEFWAGSSMYFWRMLRLTIYFIFAQLILLGVFFTLFSVLTSGGLERFQNEGEIYRRGLMILPFYFLFATVLFMIQDYAKIHVVKMDKKIIFQPILQSVRWVFKNFVPSFSLYFLNLLTFLIFFGIYWKLNDVNVVLFSFLIGQFFVFSRIGLKLLNLASATALFQQR